MKRNLLALGILYLLVTILGCASDSKRWYKPGATKQMYERDKADCEDKILDTSSTGVQGSLYSIESCMEGKGYTVLDHKAM